MSPRWRRLHAACFRRGLGARLPSASCLQAPGVFAFVQPGGLHPGPGRGRRGRNPHPGGGARRAAARPRPRLGPGRGLPCRKAWAPEPCFWKSRPAIMPRYALYAGLGFDRGRARARPIMTAEDAHVLKAALPLANPFRFRTISPNLVVQCTRRETKCDADRKTLRRQGPAHDRAAPGDRARAVGAPPTIPMRRNSTAAPPPSTRISPSPPSIARSSCSRMRASWSGTISATAAPAMRKCRKAITIISSMCRPAA